MRVNDYGFVEVGKWVLKESLRSKITFKLYGFENVRVIYAFVVGDEVTYIGVCNSYNTTLRKRMNSQRYNNIVANKIEKALRQDKSVKIFAMKPDEVYMYKDLKVDLVKGLETPLIKEFKSDKKWNKQI